ncbi:magnesium transporter CorA family protein [Lysobacter silvisoli]|nr:magnesium transporter CorA family protein [Lysobacter silvisoli]
MNSVSQATSGSGDSSAHCVLFCAKGKDQPLPLDQVRRPTDPNQLLWVDIEGDSAPLIEAAATRLELNESILGHLLQLRSTPSVRNYADVVMIQVVAVTHPGQLEFSGALLAIVAGPGFVLSLHHQPIAFIQALRQREHGQTRLGALKDSAFSASLLDWQLDSYFEAVSDFEREVERLEEAVLKGVQDEDTRALSRLRRGASRLRRMLAPHRVVFASLARPDFRPGDEPESVQHFTRLDEHFERVMDAVENARELVIGSFDLYTNQILLRTNRAMRLLTFATVVIGVQTVVAGVLGMNFDAPFFQTETVGFAAALGLMVLLTAAAAWWGKRRQWF